MKKFTNILLSVAVLAFLGCEEIILEDSDTIDNNISVHNGSIPVIKDPVGSYVDLSEYLYPKDLTTDKIFYFTKVYDYAQTSRDTFTTAPDISIRSHTKAINKDLTTITEYKDDIEQVRDDIDRDEIISTESGEDAKIYHVRVAQNSVVSDTIKGEVQEVCVVVSIGAIDLSTTTYLPVYVRNDLLNNQLKIENSNFIPEQFKFDDILHIYCGTSDNHTSDIYYTREYGRILKLQKDVDEGLLKVEVVDVLSVEN